MNNRTFKDIRQFRGLTQEKFAERLKITRSTVAQIESGRMEVSENIQSKLAHVFDVTDEDFQSYIRRKRDIERILSQRNYTEE